MVDNSNAKYTFLKNVTSLYLLGLKTGFPNNRRKELRLIDFFYLEICQITNYLYLLQRNEKRKRKKQNEMKQLSVNYDMIILFYLLEVSRKKYLSRL